ncbi:Circadian clock protein PASD1 [Bienertia sinuspersici]
MNMAWTCGYRRAIVESDCLNLINKIKRRLDQSTTVGWLVHDILKLAKTFEFIAFEHVRRGGNSLAHNIASCNDFSFSEYVWLEEFPEFVLDMASQEMCTYLQS